MKIWERIRGIWKKYFPDDQQYTTGTVKIHCFKCQQNFLLTMPDIPLGGARDKMYVSCPRNHKFVVRVGEQDILPNAPKAEWPFFVP